MSRTITILVPALLGFALRAEAQSPPKNDPDELRTSVARPEADTNALRDEIKVLKGEPAGTRQPPGAGIQGAENLFVPRDGATLDNGRVDRRDGITWEFDWPDVPGAIAYHLFVAHNPDIPLIDLSDIPESHSVYINDRAYIIDRNRKGWFWKVRAMVDGKWTDWSRERPFGVEPLNMDPPSADGLQPGATHRQITPKPGERRIQGGEDRLVPRIGATLDNGRQDRRDGITWEFDWPDMPGATAYHLFVAHSPTIPLINISDIPESHYTHIGVGDYVIESNRTGWFWKVRAMVDGEWTEWSRDRPFSVEPLNRDPLRLSALSRAPIPDRPPPSRAGGASRRGPGICRGAASAPTHLERLQSSFDPTQVGAAGLAKLL
jgi:hypothetical protein